MRYIKAGNSEKALETYNLLDEEAEYEVDKEAEIVCKNLIEEYNIGETEYDEVRESVESICYAIKGVEEYTEILDNLHHSKEAFTSGKKYYEEENWESAKNMLEDVTVEDTYYEQAQSMLEVCNNKVSLIHYENGIRFQEEKDWKSAISEYEKVESHTPDEYAKANENMEICIENVRIETYTELQQLYSAKKYDEGLEFIDSLPGYLEDDEEIANYKEKFEEGKTEEERIREANKYNTGITYNQLARDPDIYEGEYVKFRGKVLQIMTADYMTVYRIGTSGYGYYDNVIYAVHYFSNNSKNRILEDDIVTVKGVSDGLHTYETVLGSSITIPKITVDEIVR